MQSQVQGAQFFSFISCLIFRENNSLKKGRALYLSEHFIDNPFIAIITISSTYK